VAAIVGTALERLIDRARLLRAGISDSVAGWHSRYYFQGRLREEIARSQRAGTALTCAVVDVDRLGVVNDTYGQIAGDAALREIAERVQTQLRVSDATGAPRQRQVCCADAGHRRRQGHTARGTRARRCQLRAHRARAPVRAA
jgi:GGDEF domain-containing protein